MQSSFYFALSWCFSVHTETWQGYDSCLLQVTHFCCAKIHFVYASTDVIGSWWVSNIIGEASCSQSQTSGHVITTVTTVPSALWMGEKQLSCIWTLPCQPLWLGHTHHKQKVPLAMKETPKTTIMGFISIQWSLLPLVLGYWAQTAAATLLHFVFSSSAHHSRKGCDPTDIKEIRVSDGEELTAS